MIWFLSDPHFGCAKLVENTRTEFGNVDEHDNYLLMMINGMVKDNDTLVIIGDFCKEKPGRYRPKLKCKNIFFVLGNHDKECKIKAVFGGNVWTRRMVKLSGGQKVLCDHHPACFWDGCHNGTYHAYGHIHNSEEREAMMDLGMPGRRSMDVGVDMAKRLFGAYRPISELEFLDQLSGRPGHDTIKPEDRWNGKDYGDQASDG